jgi:hypothetical protein
VRKREEKMMRRLGEALAVLLMVPHLVWAESRYYLINGREGSPYPVEWGGWKTLAACQEHKAKLLGKGIKMIDPVCVKRKKRKKKNRQ